MKKVLLASILFVSYTVFPQSFNLEQAAKADWVTMNGGVSANAVFYEGAANREPFTYFLNGNLNLNIRGLYHIPISFMYSNQQFDFPTPFKFNRLSLHPSYKWLTTHIGDVSMTFSPYTLNGHQFTGAGVDIAPNGPFKISALYGRFLKTVEYDPEKPESLPAYKRMGYGLKTSYDFGAVRAGLIFFSAKDDENSIPETFPAELNVTPKANLVVSAETAFKLFDKAQVNLEYARTTITEDTRVEEDGGRQGFLSFLTERNVTTNHYNAFKAQFSYPAGNGSVGAGYERVDPGYRTLGAYFFNNDLENITVNASQQLFNNKLNVSVNGGLQRDNLDNTKSSELQRVVTSVTLAYNHSDKLSFNGMYSNFQSYTNIRNQFDYINEISEFDNLDTLNYRQISQNANAGILYFLKKDKDRQHSLNLNLSFQTSQNEQGGQAVDESSSVFYNAAAAYTMAYPERALNISFAVNATQNTLGDDDSFMVGPTLAVNKEFLDKKLRSGFSGSYNTSFSEGARQNNVYNFRLNGSYTLAEQHNFNLSLLSLFRNLPTGNSNDFTATLAYSYTFKELKLKLKKQDTTAAGGNALSKAPSVQFRYREVLYQGRLPEVTQQLRSLKEKPVFETLPSSVKAELERLFQEVETQEDAKPYREKALDFLEALSGYENFLERYDEALYTAVQKIKQELKPMDRELEKRYVEAEKALREYTGQEAAATALRQEMETAAQKLNAHRWMEEQFMNYTGKPVVATDPFLQECRAAEMDTMLKMNRDDIPMESLQAYLEPQLIQFYYQASLQERKDSKVVLRYVTNH